MRPEELLCPLRAVNGMPIAVHPAQEASLASLAALQPPAPTPQQQPTPHSPPSSRPGSLSTAPAAAPSPRADSVSSARPRSARPSASSASSPRPASARMADAQSSDSAGAEAVGVPPQAYGGVTEEVLVRSRQSGSADVGLTALWGVLNLSAHEQAQTKCVVRPGDRWVHLALTWSASSLVVACTIWDAPQLKCAHPCCARSPLLCCSRCFMHKTCPWLYACAAAAYGYACIVEGWPEKPVAPPPASQDLPPRAVHTDGGGARQR